MKTATIFTTILLVYVAQARTTAIDKVESENNIQVQLQNFIDYLDANLKSRLEETKKELRKLKKEIDDANYNFFNEKLEYILEWKSLAIENDTLHQEAKQLNVLTSDCDNIWASKLTTITEIYHKVGIYLLEKNKFIYDKNYDLRMAFMVSKGIINNSALKAKICVNQSSTSITSSSAAACLVEAKITADLAYAAAPEETELLTHRSDIQEFKRQLKTCLDAKHYDTLIQGISVFRKVNECISKKNFEAKQLRLQ